jgi:hypothetical protein
LISPPRLSVAHLKARQRSLKVRDSSKEK